MQENEKKEPCCCCTHKTKHRSEEEYKSLVHRLNRIEGQIRGIRGMVENEVYCPDILVQSAAVTAAVRRPAAMPPAGAAVSRVRAMAATRRRAPVW